MYGYSSGLTKEELFQTVSQEAVFRHVFGDFQVNNYICSPFRKDDDPGCWITWIGNRLMFKDHGSYTFLDMIGIIQTKYNLDFNTAINFIADSKFEGEPEYTKKGRKRESSFTLEFCPKPFDKYAKQYWQQYNITSSQLIEDNIFATAWFKYKNTSDQWINVSPHAKEATYTISMKQSLKICRPFVKNKKHKWITDANKNVIGGLHKLPYLGEQLVITKSYKDWRVLTNMGLTAIWLQNEGQVPDSEVLNPIISMFDNTVIWFDNDDAGKRASDKLSTIIGADQIFLPTIEKDPADVVKAGDTQFLQNFIFKYLNNRIYGNS